jgi:hypothetical protein
LVACAARIASGFTALSCRQVALLLRTNVEDPTKPQRTDIDRLLAIAPEIAAARTLAGRFADMVKQRLADDLDGWFDAVENSEPRFGADRGPVPIEFPFATSKHCSHLR